jgi:hypothetical protein
MATTHRDSRRKVNGMKNVTGPNYEMSYPCLILMNGAANPAPPAIMVAGKWCMCLFRDRDVLNKFYLTHRQDPSPAGLTVHVAEISDRKSLIGTLKDWKSNLLQLEMTHVALDPDAERGVLTAGIDDFIALLQRQK